MFCVKCGSEVAGQFCTSCGTPMNDVTNPGLSSEETIRRPGPPAAMVAPLSAAEAHEVAPEPGRSRGSTGAVVGSVLAIAIVAAAVVGVTWIVRNSESKQSAIAPPSGSASPTAASSSPATAKPAAVTPPPAQQVAKPVAGAIYWTSTLGTTKCVYYPRNVSGEPSVNCWHTKRGIVYHLYPGKPVKADYMSALTPDRARDLANQFNAATGPAWPIGQSQSFLDPRTGAVAFECTLYADPGMFCTQTSFIHGFQLNQDTPKAW